MDAFATDSSIALNDARPVPTPHAYGTRIRHNILIKPAARLRQSPDPPARRKYKPVPSRPAPDSNSPSNLPQFPPPHIVLHPDDANSKVFLAIGRSLLSVDNRAMTVKDLAKMSVNFGLVCQNVSAASQAIHTYLRAHEKRCESEQDHPLLLRHVLSGTASDDDLIPALHSRSGGAHRATSSEGRATNFRSGTSVLYLSRVTGAPCPFSRAGIRLCDYSTKATNASDVKENKRETGMLRRTERHCGEKRKRPIRGCSGRVSDSDSQDDDEKPPPKVKLTLRLKPLFPKFSSGHASSSSSNCTPIVDISRDSDSEDSQDESMSVDSSDDEDHPAEQQVEEKPWSLPPYPRRAISIPCYTPSFDGSCQQFPSPSDQHVNYRRSPSVPYSVASPPPDSEAEDDDYHITMTGARRCSAARTPARVDVDLDWDADFDSEGDLETMWESPGPRSPSAPPQHLADVAVKEEPRDVQGMLEAWEYFDCNTTVANIIKVSSFELDTDPLARIKTETFDSLDWESSYRATREWDSPDDERLSYIKQEDLDFDSLLSPRSLRSDCHSSSSVTGLSSPGIQSSASPQPCADSSTTGSLPEGAGMTRCQSDPQCDNGSDFSTIRPRVKTASSLPTSLLLNPPQSPRSDYPKIPSESGSSSSLSDSQSLISLIQSMSMSSPTSVAPSSLLIPPPCVSPQDTHYKRAIPSDVVVVHTCHPCTPPISATQVEGISVYQMKLGSFTLLRRIDTDFVNLSPIFAYSGAPCPVLSTIPNATLVANGSTAVSGIWVPLSAAQVYMQDHPLPRNDLNVFLSDVLFERFPTALQDFHKSSTQGRLLNHFGPHFGSTLQATQLSSPADMSPSASVETWESKLGWGHEESLKPSESAPLLDRHFEEDQPLSATEQEIFHTLCANSDWDQDSPVLSSAPLTEEKENIAMLTDCAVAHPPEPITTELALERSDRPLRRSKRVADAIAARTRTRSRRRGSRNSLS